MAIEQYCIIELMGHQRIAGMVSEEEVAGTPFIRVDVPEVDGLVAFTKFFSTSAVYSITPVDKPTCLRAVAGYREKPIETWRLAETIALPEPDEDDVPDFYDEPDVEDIQF